MKPLHFKISLNLFFLFMTLPLTLLAIIPNFYNQTSIPKLYTLVICTLLTMLFNKHLRIQKSTEFKILVLLSTYYIYNQVRLEQDLETFLLGSNGRYVGLIALIFLTIQFAFFSSIKLSELKIFMRFTFYSYFIINLIGLVIISKITTINESGYTGGLSTTLQNSNFLSAYLGILISLQIYFFLSKTNEPKFFQIIFFIIGVINLIATKSIQGYFIIFLSSILITVWKVSKNKHIKAIGVFTIIIMSSVLVRINDIVEWVILNGNVNARLSYWELAIRIWRENIWFGVGLEQMRPNSILYRDQLLTLQEGVIVAPDRSHNLILDQFVWGGLIAGILWLVFISLINYQCIKLFILIKRQRVSNDFMYPIIIWSGFFFQSLISVSQLTLTLMGFTAAGIIMSSKQNIKSSANI